MEKGSTASHGGEDLEMSDTDQGCQASDRAEDVQPDVLRKWQILDSLKEAILKTLREILTVFDQIQDSECEKLRSDIFLEIQTVADEIAVLLCKMGNGKKKVLWSCKEEDKDTFHRVFCQNVSVPPPDRPEQEIPRVHQSGAQRFSCQSSLILHLSFKKTKIRNPLWQSAKIFLTVTFWVSCKVSVIKSPAPHYQTLSPTQFLWENLRRMSWFLGCILQCINT